MFTIHVKKRKYPPIISSSRYICGSLVHIETWSVYIKHVRDCRAHVWSWTDATRTLTCSQNPRRRAEWPRCRCPSPPPRASPAAAAHPCPHPWRSRTRCRCSPSLGRRCPSPRFAVRTQITNQRYILIPGHFKIHMIQWCFNRANSSWS